MTAETPTASSVDADARPIAELNLNPYKSTAAPWEAIYPMHGVMVSSRYWTKEAANTALSDAGFRVVEKDQIMEPAKLTNFVSPSVRATTLPQDGGPMSRDQNSMKQSDAAEGGFISASDQSPKARSERRKLGIKLARIEGNPLTDDEVAMFEMFDREGWTDEQIDKYILEYALKVDQSARAR